ncbi:MAG TPA: undecaprenyldiphospho-muramoylpentapeptide beta-N-acetylglucosaminyltransferase [Actinomycetota bacterium]|nr:undecaprenyldiphospho-muramoylpentapeptide beta-N-acetylglucosaminyltransferase [Actinomycetota bacterium]
MRSFRVLIAAGGTAGHVFPGLAVARSLRDRFGADILFIGRPDGQEATLVPEAGFRLATVEARPFVRRISFAALRAPVTALRAAGKARRIARGADVVLGMGGYVSVPVSLAAGRERVPLVIHEQNAVLGLANRVAARWAAAVALGFEDASSGVPGRTPAVVTGNPVREGVLRVPLERDALAKEAFREFGLEPDRKTIAIFGGSQGALHLNQAAVGATRILDGRSDLQILLITGPNHHERFRREIRPGGGLLLRAEAFVDRMELVYASADLAVSRAGASTVAELTVCGVPALLIPYPYATGRHQEANARALQRAGGARVLLDDQLGAESLADRIIELVDHRERLALMAEASTSFGKPDAAGALATLAAESARTRPSA